VVIFMVLGSKICMKIEKGNVNLVFSFIIESYKKTHSL